MSFNIQGNNVQHDVINEDWVDQIVQVIKMSKADIVLLQEVRLLRESPANNLLESLVSKLNKKGDNWNFCSSVRYAKCRMDLHNAILYNAKNVTLKKDLAYNPPFNFVQYYLSNDENQMTQITRIFVCVSNDCIVKSQFPYQISHFYKK